MASTWIEVLFALLCLQIVVCPITIPFILLTIYHIFRSPLSAIEIVFELVEMIFLQKPTINAIESSSDEPDPALLIPPYPKSQLSSTEWPYHAHRKYAESHSPSGPLISPEKALEMRYQFAQFQKWHHGLNSSQTLTLPAAVPSVTANLGVFHLLSLLQAIGTDMYSLLITLDGHLTNEWALRNYCNTLLNDILVPAIDCLSAGQFDLASLLRELDWPLEPLQRLHAHLCLLDTSPSSAFLDIISGIETTFYLLGITLHRPIIDTKTPEISPPPPRPIPEPMTPPRPIPEPLSPPRPIPEPLSPPTPVPNSTSAPGPRAGRSSIAAPVGGFVQGRKPGTFGVSK
ncbi:hypothetical protein BCR34DRAFT_601782 [Clohesyomyces aquaticus]|uniref:Uncharacterized protein n=1 Tax=Clohesyomyces aquaticus TaxID=1231657 RepID=A0A1Y1ZLI1_9PLEO|nr:hypothetical protein BCR34DRAFT_601782 [Clohesyomyces aquaticus]